MQRFCSAATFCVLLLLVGIAGAQTHSIEPEDTGEALVNPSMGWTLHFYSNVPANYGSRLEPADTLDDFPGLSTVYLRLPWAYLEPSEGQYNWAVFDTPAQRFIEKGKRVALRLTCSENWMAYATPKWVRDSGAKGTHYQFGKGRVEAGGSWDPFFDDAVFIEKLDTFLAAYAKRYDGNPNLAFIDIGTFGLWGEGHTHMSSQQDEIDIQKLHIDLHLKHLKKTQLCISDDYAGHHKPGKHFPITDYALEQGVTIRDDSILANPNKGAPAWYHAEMAQAFWPKHPVILEHEHITNAKKHGRWDPEAVIASVEAYHASYLSIHGEPKQYLQDNKAMIDAINQRLGYRIMPVKVTWPREVTIPTQQEAYTRRGDPSRQSDPVKPLLIDWEWVNKGVAPCYPGGFPAITIKDQEGGIVSVLVDESFDVRDLKVGNKGEAPIAKHQSKLILGLYAPTTRPGTYDVYISVGERDGTPVIAMPLADGDGKRRYRIGTIKLIAGEPVEAKP